MKKRYRLIDLKTGKIFEYYFIEFTVAFWLMWMLGIITGHLIYLIHLLWK